MLMSNLAPNLQKPIALNDLLTFTPAPAAELVCPCCQRPLATFSQPAMLPGRPDRDYAHCLNNACVNYYNTQHISFYLGAA